VVLPGLKSGQALVKKKKKKEEKKKKKKKKKRFLRSKFL
jgi:hypothetical protein